MPNIYVLQGDRNLSQKESSSHLLNEHNAESLTILVPQIYSGKDISRCVAVIEFRRGKNGEKIKSAQIKPQKDTYKDYLVYKMLIARDLTNKIGKVYFGMTFDLADFHLTTSFNSYFEIRE